MAYWNNQTSREQSPINKGMRLLMAEGRTTTNYINYPKEETKSQIITQSKISLGLSSSTIQQGSAFPQSPIGNRISLISRDKKKNQIPLPINQTHWIASTSPQQVSMINVLQENKNYANIQNQIYFNQNSPIISTPQIRGVPLNQLNHTPTSSPLRSHLNSSNVFPSTQYRTPSPFKGQKSDLNTSGIRIISSKPQIEYRTGMGSGINNSTAQIYQPIKILKNNENQPPHIQSHIQLARANSHSQLNHQNYPLKQKNMQPNALNQRTTPICQQQLLKMNNQDNYQRISPSPIHYQKYNQQVSPSPNISPQTQKQQFPPPQTHNQFINSTSQVSSHLGRPSSYSCLPLAESINLNTSNNTISTMKRNSMPPLPPPQQQMLQGYQNNQQIILVPHASQFQQEQKSFYQDKCKIPFENKQKNSLRGTTVYQQHTQFVPPLQNRVRPHQQSLIIMSPQFVPSELKSNDMYSPSGSTPLKSNSHQKMIRSNSELGNHMFENNKFRDPFEQQVNNSCQISSNQDILLKQEEFLVERQKQKCNNNNNNQEYKIQINSTKNKMQEQSILQGFSQQDSKIMKQMQSTDSANFMNQSGPNFINFGQQKTQEQEVVGSFCGRSSSNDTHHFFGVQQSTTKFKGESINSWPLFSDAEIFERKQEQSHAENLSKNNKILEEIEDVMQAQNQHDFRASPTRESYSQNDHIDLQRESSRSPFKFFARVKEQLSTLNAINGNQQIINSSLVEHSFSGKDEGFLSKFSQIINQEQQNKKGFNQQEKSSTFQLEQSRQQIQNIKERLAKISKENPIVPESQ